MKRFRIQNHKSGLSFQVEREELGAHQPEWGKHVRYLTKEELEREGLTIEDVVDMWTEERMGEEVDIYEVPAEYTIEIEDITAEIEAREAKAQAEKVIQKKLERIEFGKRIIALISISNDAKELSSESLIALMSDPHIQMIKGLLETGAIQTARDAIAMYQVSEESVFTEEDRTLLLNELDAFLGAEAG